MTHVMGHTEVERQQKACRYSQTDLQVYSMLPDGLRHQYLYPTTGSARVAFLLLFGIQYDFAQSM